MSLLDTFTGGKNQSAEEDLKRALQSVGGVDTPTAEQLSLPELQKYVQAGMMTPAQAEAVLQGPNAYDAIKTNPANTEAEMTALNQMQDVASSHGMTPQMRARMTAALDTANTNTAGQRGSILDQAAQKGVPTSLMATAAQMAAAGDDARTANLTGTAAAGEAEQNALAAMSGAGTMAGNIENQQFGEQAKKAEAENAIKNWNAANQTSVNMTNAGMKQQANAVNTANSQDITNKNTGNANFRTQYNAGVPQTVFNDKMQKATNQAAVDKQQADNATAQGQQEAGLWSGLIGAGATMVGGPAAGYAATKATKPGMAEGGEVPGHASIPGDSPRNDKVHAMLSPGEVVVPRSMASNPEMAKNFIAHLMKQKAGPRPAHPEDVRSVLDALSSRRAA